MHGLHEGWRTSGGQFATANCPPYNCVPLREGPCGTGAVSDGLPFASVESSTGGDKPLPYGTVTLNAAASRAVGTTRGVTPFRLFRNRPSPTD